MSLENENIVWHATSVTKEDRSELKKQKPCILWFTGFSGSGKSTIANAVEKKLNLLSHHTYLLDGDNVRHGLNKGLTFSDEDRIENIRRIGELSKLFVDSGLIVLTAFVSPFRSERQMVRDLVEEGELIEVFMDTPLSTCEDRDPKGLYKKARAGEIANFTGIDSTYEPPVSPEITLDASKMGIEECADTVLAYLREKGKLTSN